MPQLGLVPFYRAIDASGVPIPNVRLYTFLTGGLTPAATYTTSALSVSHGAYVQADSAGFFPAFYLDPAVTYRFQHRIAPYAAAITGHDFDPITSITSADITFLQVGTGADARTLQAELRDHGLRPEHFSASGDGSADDTAELQELFAAASVAARPEVHLTGGKTYLITGSGSDDVILPLTRGIKLYGHGATIKIANGSTGFHAIIGSKDAGVDLSGLHIEGVIFDHNGANETGNPARTSYVLDRHRYTVKAKRGDGFTFVHNKVINHVSTNCIHWNGDGNTSNSRVGGNYFEAAEPNGNTEFDHSTLYLTGDGINVHDNTFENASFGSANGRCAIEVHPGVGCKISDNIIRKYHTGINYVGVYETASERGSITGNVLDVLRRGIALLSTTYLSHTTGYGIDGLNIDGNQITVHNQTSQGFITQGGAGCFGISLLSSSIVLATRGIKIGGGNQIRFDLETTTPDWDSLPAGISFGQTTGTVVHEDINIGDVTIVNAPVLGIVIGDGGGVYKNVSIGRPKIINAGSSAKSGAQLAATNRTAFKIRCDALTGFFRADGIHIVDSRATSRLVNGVTIESVNAVTAPVDITAFISIDDATHTSYVADIDKVDNNIVPSVNLTSNVAFVFGASDSFRKGSTLFNRTLGIRYEMMTDGGATFVRTTPMFGTATWDPGSVDLNTPATTTVTVTGAAVGDPVRMSHSIVLGGLFSHGEVLSADTVTVYLTQPDANAVGVDLVSHTVQAEVTKKLA